MKTNNPPNVKPSIRLLYRPATLPAAISLALTLGTAQAADLTVTGDLDALPAIDGICTLREAIENANDNAATHPDCPAGDPGLDQILFDPAIETIQLGPPIRIDEELSIRADHQHVTLLGSGLTRLFNIPVADVATEWRNVTLSGGFTDTPGDFVPSCLRLSGEGAALCSLGPVSLYDSAIRDSQTTGDMAVGGGLVAAELFMERSSLLNNQTLGDQASGGGARVIRSGSATIRNSLISGNRTYGQNSRGGGISVANNLSLTNSLVSGNETAGDGSGGGGIDAYGQLDLLDTTVAGNVTQGFSASGGGLRNSGTTSLINSTVSNNQISGDSSAGGGLWSFGDTMLSNSTISGNAANSGAGGVQVRVYGDTTASIMSTILAANAGPEGNFNFGVLSGSTLLAVGSSVFGDSPLEINGLNTANQFVDLPGLMPLADNGCYASLGDPNNSTCVTTRLLTPNSVARDNGQTLPGLDFDQRGQGFDRMLGSQTDIGAIEMPSGALPPPPPPLSPMAVPVLDLKHSALTATLILLLGLFGWRKRFRQYD